MNTNLIESGIISSSCPFLVRFNESIALLKPLELKLDVYMCTRLHMSVLFSFELGGVTSEIAIFRDNPLRMLKKFSKK